MATYGERSELESGHVLFQIKATDSLHVVSSGTLIAIRVKVADLKAWQDELMPVILVVYDGRADQAYWLYIQEYLDQKNVSGDDFLVDQERVTVRIPIANQLNLKAIDRFRAIRDLHVKGSKGNRHV